MNTADQLTAPHTWLAPLSVFVRERLGLHFPEDHWNDLQRNFLKAVDAFGHTDPATCLHQLMHPELPARKLHKLAGFLTIGETYFFREKNSFEPMARHLFNEVIDRKRKHGQKQLKIWSAACSTGEEPYSIAMLLDAMLPDIDEWSIRILATDINPVFLDRARTAVYRPWSFRGTPDWVKQRYFQIDGEAHTVRPDIQNRVTFDFLNLADDIYPSLATQTQAMDVIFCRNVLIYFSQEQACKVISRMQESLTENGWLVLSPTETVYVTDPVLHRQHIHNSILYQKNTTRPPGRNRWESKPFLPPHSIRTNTFQTEEKKNRLSVSLPTFELKTPPRVPMASTGTPRPEQSREKPEQASVLQRAEKLYSEGRHVETIELITEHLKGQPAQGGEAFLLARAQANSGSLDDALPNALNAVETDKLNAKHHYLLAMIQLEQNALPEAQRSLQRVMYLDEMHIMAFFSSGHLAIQQDNISLAKKHFTQALHLLEGLSSDDPVPEGEGMTAQHLKELIGCALEEQA